MDRADVAIEQWARERPDLPALPMALLGRLSEAAERMMRDHHNPLFAEAGLQPGEFDVLATLRRSGAPYMLSPTRLYEAAMISSGGMTNRLDRLEQAGLIERRPGRSPRQADRAHRRRQARHRRDHHPPCRERASAAVGTHPRRAGAAQRPAPEADRRAVESSAIKSGEASSGPIGKLKSAGPGCYAAPLPPRRKNRRLCSRPRPALALKHRVLLPSIRSHVPRPC
jgi:DNA-binding MarR family transcriptional regulator